METHTSLQACEHSTGIMAASLSCFEEINKLVDKVLSVVRETRGGGLLSCYPWKCNFSGELVDSVSEP